MISLEAFGAACLIAIVLCLAIATIGAIRRNFWLWIYSLVGVIAIIFVALTVLNIQRYQIILTKWENARPIFEPIKDEMMRE